MVCLFSRCPRAVTGGYLGSGPSSGEQITWFFKIKLGSSPFTKIFTNHHLIILIVNNHKKLSSTIGQDVHHPHQYGHHPPYHLIIRMNKESNGLSGRPSSKLLFGNNHSVPSRWEPVMMVMTTMMVTMMVMNLMMVTMMMMNMMIMMLIMMMVMTMVKTTTQCQVARNMQVISMA